MTRTKIVQDGKAYFAAKIAAKRVDLVPDYISRLARQGLVEGIYAEGLWYVNIESVVRFSENQRARKRALAERASIERRAVLGRAAQVESPEALPAPITTRGVWLLTAAMCTLVMVAALGVRTLSIIPDAAPAASGSVFARIAESVRYATCQVFHSCHDTALIDTPVLVDGIASSEHSVPSASSILAATATHIDDARTTPAETAAKAERPRTIVERVIERAVAPVDAVTHRELTIALASLDGNLRSDVGLMFGRLGENSRFPSQVAAGGNQTGIAAALLAASQPAPAAAAPSASGPVAASSITGTLTNAIDSALGVIASLSGDDLTYSRASFDEATSTVLHAGSLSLGSDCSAYGNGGKLTTDAAGNVVCSADQGGAGGTVGGLANQIQYNDFGVFGGTSSFTFSTTSARLSVTNASTTALSSGYASSTHLFAGSLSLSNLADTLLYANAAGSVTNVATSSLGLPTFADLGSYLSLASWYATSSAPQLTELTNLSITSSQVSDFDSGVNAYLHSSTTVPKTYANNAFSGTQTFLGASTTNLSASYASSTRGFFGMLSLAAFDGPLQANGGLVSATSSIGVLYGGTGLASAPGFGQILMGQADGTYTLVATSSLGIVGGGGSASSTLLSDSNTFSGTNTFTQTITGSVSGNAGTATALQNARAINGVSFDGTADITIAAASSTLLADSSRFTGSNVFAGNTSLAGATSSSFAIANLADTLLYANGSGSIIPVATSSLGLPTFADVSSSLSNYLALVDWYSTTTDQLAEGTNHLYFTTARATTSFVGNLAATTSVASITTLPNLSLPSSQVTGLFAYLFPGNATTTEIAFNGGLTASRSTTTNATTTSFAISGIANAIPVANGSGSLSAYTGTSCTNQFVRSLNGSGVATCATVQNTDLANSSITINGSSVSLGGSITVSSTTLLADSSRFTGTNTFATLPVLSTLTGLVGSNNGSLYQISTTSMNASITGQAGSVANAVTFNNGGAGGASGSTFNGSGALTVSYNTIGAQPAGTYVNSVSASWPLVSSGGTTPTISWSGLSTTSNLTTGQVVYASGSGSITSIATSTPTIGSVLTYSGTLGNMIGGVSGTFGIANSAITNAMLANSTISGVSLGGTLNALTAGNTSLTFSGSYDGSTARTVSLNMGNANTWTALQTFSYASSTGFSTSYASSTSAFFGSLTIPSLTSTLLKTDGTGKLTAAVAGTDYANFAYPFPSAATTTELSLNGGLSTTYASTTQIGSTGNAYFATSGGTVGIASTTPWGLLSVNPNGITGPAFVVGSSTATSFVVTNGGNVGIGTTSPGAALAVSGAILTDATFSIQSAISTNSSVLRVTNGGGTSFLGNDNSTGSGLGSGLPYALSLYAAGTNAISFMTNGSNRVTISGTGNVGIGTTSPGSLFSIGSSGTGWNFFDNATTTSYAKGIDLKNGGCFAINGVCISGGGVGSSFAFPFTTGTNFGATTNSTTTNLSLFAGLNASTTVRFGNAGVTGQFLWDGTNGKLGLGTSTPWQLLSVAGTVATNAILPNGPYTTNLSAYDLGATGQRWNALWAGALNIGTSTFSLKSNSASGLGFYTAASGGGTEAMTISTSGNVGIGTTGPWEALSLPYNSKISLGASSLYNFNIYKSVAGNLDTYFDSRDDVAANKMYFRMRTGGTPVNVLTMQADGNVGIGTTTPGTLLHVNSGATDEVARFEGTGSPYISLYDSGTRYAYVQGTATGAHMVAQGVDLLLTTTAANNVYLNTNGSTRMTVNSSGNVGIGSTSPSNLLSLRKTSPASIIDLLSLSNESTQGSGSRILFNGTYGAQSAIKSVVSPGDGSFDNEGDLVFQTAVDSVLSDRLTIKYNGNVGIGTTTPNQALSVVGRIMTTGSSYTTNPQGPIFGQYDSTTGYAQAPAGGKFQIWDDATAALATFADNGNVGIGSTVTSPGYKLDVAGDVNVSAGSCFRVNGVCIGYTVKLAAVYATSTAGTTTVQFTGTQGSAPSFSAGSPGTLTLPSNASSIVAEVWGAGGGGAQSAGVGGVGGGGGGGGGYTSKNYTSLNSRYYFTIGAGGAGGGISASTGKTSSFGTGSATTTANGGAGATSYAIGGSGGSASGGDINMNGTGGGSGATPYGGHGGNAPRGGGGGKAETAGSAFGGGGGGGTDGNGGATGGAGGVVISVYATSSPTAAGNDYAEMFPVSNPGITAGDIVSVDGGMPVNMKLAKKGDRALAGVISTAPGQTLGDQSAQGMRPVALAGRVPVKFSSMNGNVEIGDRIAPSSIPGVGIKAGPFDDSVGIVIDTPTTDENGNTTVMIFLDLHKGIDINALGFALLTNGSTALSTSSAQVATSTGPFDFVGDMMQAIAERIAAIPATELSYTAAFSTATSTAATTTEVAATTTSTSSDSFATALIRSIVAKLAAWFADAANGIGDFFANRVHTKELCVSKADGSEVCITGDQLASLLANQSAASAAGWAPSGATDGAHPAATSSATLVVSGNDPLTWPLGAPWADNLGALLTQGDASETIYSTSTVDTMIAGTTTIEYWATWHPDPAASSTETVHATRDVVVIDPNPLTASTTVTGTTTPATD